MTPFRQVIRPGQDGADVWAVKRAYAKMRVHGYEGLAHDKHAGHTFVQATKQVQRAHNLRSDGIYGEATHKLVAPHFDAYGRTLYRSAKLRFNAAPVGLPAQQAAQRLLQLASRGKYHADNHGDLLDIQRAAQGLAVWSQGGYWVHIDRRVFDVLLYLIEVDNSSVGTYAICSDHHNDGPHGHSGGRAVDISSIGGVAVGSGSARTPTLHVARLLRASTPALLRPRQLICGGYGYHRDGDISSCSVPAADSYYGSGTMAEHCNHIHWGC